MEIEKLEKEFKNWLEAKNYSKSALKSYPALVRRYSAYLKLTQKTINNRSINLFFKHWKSSKNQMTGGGLSNNYANQMINALSVFAKYLKTYHQINIEIQLKRKRDSIQKIKFLTKTEIQKLYEASYLLIGQISPEILGIRDRAILSVFYGCGLRRQEGINLNINNIDIDKKLLTVKSGKANKDRFVPISESHLNYIEDYLRIRNWFLITHDTSKIKQIQKEKANYSAFFLSIKGTRMKEFTFRLRNLCKLSNIEQFALHSLRHSIATHLLQAGMKIEYISQFLGHSSLNSTQIYTHL